MITLGHSHASVDAVVFIATFLALITTGPELSVVFLLGCLPNKARSPGLSYYLTHSCGEKFICVKVNAKILVFVCRLLLRQLSRRHGD